MKGEQITACSICGGQPGLKHGFCPGYQQPDTYQIYHCSHCNTAFALPRHATDALYETIYKLSDKIPGYERYHRYTREIKDHNNPLEYLAQAEEAYWGVKVALQQLVKDKSSTTILEIGSGLGYLTYALNQAKYNVLGLDISQTAVERAINNFGAHYLFTDLFEYATTHPATFDVVILTEVMEHVENPLAFITALNKLLKPGGHAIITTPNKSFYFKDILWSTELPPVHFWWFSETSITRLANHAGMQISFIDFSAFYQNRYLAIDMKKLSCSPPQQPVLNQSGELIKSNNHLNKHSNSPIRAMLSEIPILLKLYRRIKASFNKNLVVCSLRGPILCAILQKPQDFFAP
ncbi:MAG: class I SAM-dependent methyltransferase [Prolixibacteraceae bacterium]